MISLSQGVRPLLDLVQFRCGVALELLDPSLRIVPLDPATEVATLVHEPGVRERCLEVIRSGERVDRNLPSPLAFYPIRRNRQIAGVLIVAPRAQAGGVAGAPPESSLFELAGQLAKAAIEHDLGSTAHAAETADRMRRFEGILRFLTHLTMREGERPLMRAVIQAATVWFDVDCRIYKREKDDSFALFAALPGVDPGELHGRVEGARLRQLAAKRRVSAGELEFSAWRTPRGEFLCLPIGGGVDWFLLLAGVITPEVEMTFAAIVQAVGGALLEAANRRADAWRRRLDVYSGDLGAARERVSLHMLQELAAAANLSGARLSVHHAGTQRLIAAFTRSGESSASAADRGAPTARLVRSMALTANVEMQLELTRSQDPFDDHVLAVIDAWIVTMRPWLQGAAPMLVIEAPADSAAEETSFERRIQDEIERAKRFDLNLGLVLIGVEQAAGARAPIESVIDAVRPELRASDLIGRVGGGRVAVLLVHAGAESAGSVARRLRRRLASVVRETPLGPIRLGQSSFSPDRQTTRELIRDAVHRLEELHTTAQNG